MIEWLKIILLGIVEGITEFLPISSTGHLIVATALLKPQIIPPNTFEIFIQLGAIVAVVFYYRLEIIDQIRTWNTPQTQQFWLRIIIASIPAAILGLLLGDCIKAALFSPTVVALSLIIGGVIILFAERSSPGETPKTAFSQITIRQALLVGLAQCIALIPGISRSGASIIGGIQVGLDREAATKFSFYLAIPVLGGATVYELLSSISTITSEQLAALVVGTIVSAVVAWLAIDRLLKFIRTNTFIPFGIYRIIAGVVILLLLAIGMI